MASITDVAQILGISDRAVDRLVARGVLPRAKRGSHDLDTCRRLYDAHKASKSRPETRKQEATRHRLHVEAQLLQLRYEREVAKYVLVEDVAVAIREDYDRVRARCGRIGGDIAHKCAKATDPAIAFDIILSAVNQALADLSSEAHARVDPEMLEPHLRAQFLAKEAR